jgi:pimeloyl-ACP methyl ester carboxylesterase
MAVGAVLLAGWLSLAGAVRGGDAPFPGKKSQWRTFDRYDLTIAGRPAWVIAPKETAPGKPWIWRALFFDAFPQADAALVGKGFHLFFVNTSDMYGSPASMAEWDACYQEMTEKYGFPKKVALEALSRGGLVTINWAAAHPERVACIYADAAVFDWKSWPAGKGKSKGDAGSWKTLMNAYKFKSEAEALAYDKIPVDNLKPLADAKIPIFCVCGGADEVVPYEENTAIVKERYEKLGGSIQVIVKPKCGHHPHSLEDPAPIVEFVMQHCGGK